MKTKGHELLKPFFDKLFIAEQTIPAVPCIPGVEAIEVEPVVEGDDKLGIIGKLDSESVCILR